MEDKTNALWDKINNFAFGLLFPCAVSWYLLLRVENTLQELGESLARNNEMITVILELIKLQY